MKLSDFRNLDFQNAGGWPQSVKLVFCSILFILLMIAAGISSWTIGRRSCSANRAKKSS